LFVFGFVCRLFYPCQFNSMSAHHNEKMLQLVGADV
jgi:hypothetical protein